MHRITVAKLEDNLDYYLELSNVEDIYVIENNKVITVLTNPEKHKLSLVEEVSGLFGKVDNEIDYDEVLKKALTEKCIF